MFLWALSALSGVVGHRNEKRPRVVSYSAVSFPSTLAVVQIGQTDTDSGDPLTSCLGDLVRERVFSLGRLDRRPRWRSPKSRLSAYGPERDYGSPAQEVDLVAEPALSLGPVSRRLGESASPEVVRKRFSFSVPVFPAEAVFTADGESGLCTLAAGSPVATGLDRCSLSDPRGSLFGRRADLKKLTSTTLSVSSRERPQSPRGRKN